MPGGSSRRDKSFNALSREVLGFHPLLFRPPYGEYNARIIRLAGSRIVYIMEYQLIHAFRSEKEYTLAGLKSVCMMEAVLLFHTAYPAVAETLPDIIEFIKWKGYSIGSPEKILEKYTD